MHGHVSSCKSLTANLARQLANSSERDNFFCIGLMTATGNDCSAKCRKYKQGNNMFLASLAFLYTVLMKDPRPEQDLN